MEAGSELRPSEAAFFGSAVACVVIAILWALPDGIGLGEVGIVVSWRALVLGSPNQT